MLYVTKLKSKKSDKEYLALIKENVSGKKNIITFDSLVIYKLVRKKRSDVELGEKIPIIPSGFCNTCKHFLGCEPSTCGICDDYNPSK